MNILLVHNSYQQPGGEDVVFTQERHLLERMGHTVTVYRRSNCEAEEYSGFKRLKLVQITIWAKESRQHIAALLARAKPDVVHVHNFFFMVSPSIFSACRAAGVPIVQTLHNYRLYCPTATFFRDGHICEDCVQHSLLRGVAHGCYRGSRLATAAVAMMLAFHRRRRTWEADVDCYIALTKFAKSRFIEAGLPADRVFVKANFVDPDPGMYFESHRDYALFVGRLSEERVRVMLSAWDRLGKPGIPLVIVGGGPMLQQFEREASSRGLKDILFLGHVPRPKVWAAMQRARFLIFSSEWYENFPLTIAESFACGVPVVCSQLGAMAEIVEDTRTGLHFVTGNASDLAAKVRWAWDHPRQMRSMGKEARDEYEKKYTAEKNYPTLMGIYERAMAGRSVATA
jgi:glycosyltransferase involved in cell wall biosynthesis